MEDFKIGDRVRHKFRDQETIIKYIDGIGINWTATGHYEMINGNYEKVEPSILDELMSQITPEEMEQTKVEMINKAKKPPIGIVPRRIFEEHRASEIAMAVERYTSHAHPIPIEWVEEYNEIVNKYKL
jgi:hypothetical protein